MTQNPERPCTQCEKPTRLLWSWDMDLPALPFCCENHALIWKLEAQMQIGEEERAERKAADDE